MNEWEFTGDVNSWINEIIGHTPIPPFDRSKVETTSAGSRKRNDLTILDKSKRALITGEIKLPYQADGNSPYISKIVADARKKARRAKAKFFFTWNVNECVLWETDPDDPSKLGQDYKSWQVANVHNDTQLQHQATENEIRHWLPKFLHEIARIVEGTVTIGRKPPDQKFIDALESSMKMPIQFSYNRLDKLYKTKREKTRIDKWMREDQGWTIYDDPEGIRENLDRAAKFACYALVNKIVFHEALLKRYSTRLRKLRTPDHIDSGERLWSHLESYFKGTIKVTGDYETVFGEDHRSVGNKIPFYSDEAVPHWCALIDQIHDFDFSKLDHEVIGTLFERLLSPEERHKYGQYYTRVEIVDLINSFCIRKGDEKVMDPACGGGTFLVRAYTRMKTLMPDQPHGDILKNLYGVDIMNFATHLTTINLAVRDLIDDENYPQVVRSDFFDVQADKIFATLPKKALSKGSGKTQHREVSVSSLDAIIGNPPYIRQEEIPKAKKPIYKDLAKTEGSVTLSGRSDIHCYFWPHATTFLKQDGYLCLLTSSQWLDVEYGFKLQEWILRNFEIHAIFESIDEPWFIGARVATTVTILKKQTVESKRMDNTVRFVQLRRSMEEILSNDGTGSGAIQSADDFRNEIMELTENTVNDRYRARLVNQKELWDSGVDLGVTMGKTDGKYFGGKWGMQLRAPELWFEFVERFGNNLVPLTEVAPAHFGVKTGADKFFLPRDVSNEALTETSDPSEFATTYGVSQRSVRSGKNAIIGCSDRRSVRKVIEREFLEPEIHSLMHVDRFSVTDDSCPYMIVLIGKSRIDLKGTKALEYIRWGESQGFHETSTCAARKTDEHDWYDLTRFKRPSVVVPKIQQYRLIAFTNDDSLYQNSSLLGIYDISDESADIACAVLNSTLSLLSRLMYARILGNEGNIQLDVYSANMMLVPDFRAVSSISIKGKVLGAFRKMKERKVIPFVSERRLRRMALTRSGREDELEQLSDVSELDMPDRLALDHAVLESMGMRSKAERVILLENVYDYFRRFFELTRQKEEKAIINKGLSKRRGRLKPADIAAQILEEIQATETWLLKQYDTDFIDEEKPFDAYDIPDVGEPRQSPDMFTGDGLTFYKGKKQKAGHVQTKHKAQDDLIILLVEEGQRGLMRVPHKSDECAGVLRKYAKFVEERDKKLLGIVAERTSDEDLQEKILVALKSLLAQ